LLNKLLPLLAFSALLLVPLGAQNAFGSLIGDTVSGDVTTNNGVTNVFVPTQTEVVSGAVEFSFNYGSDEIIDVDVDSSTITVTFSDFTNFWFWPDGNDPVEVRISDLDWVNDPSGIVTGATIVSAPTGFGETVQVIDPHTVQLDINLHTGQQIPNGVFATVVIELQTQHGIVAGEIIPIEATSLILAGLQTPAVWMISTLSALGIGAFVFTRNPSNVRNIKVILQDYLDRF